MEILFRNIQNILKKDSMNEKRQKKNFLYLRKYIQHSQKQEDICV